MGGSLYANSPLLAILNRHYFKIKLIKSKQTQESHLLEPARSGVGCVVGGSTGR